MYHYLDNNKDHEGTCKILQQFKQKQQTTDKQTKIFPQTRFT